MGSAEPLGKRASAPNVRHNHGPTIVLSNPLFVGSDPCEGGVPTIGARLKGPLAPYAPGFHTSLIDLGYAESYAERMMQLVSHVNRWMMEAGLGPDDLTAQVADRFLATRRTQGHRVWISPAAMRPLLDHLRGIGVAPEPLAEEPPITELGRLLDEYRTYLIEERGLMPNTVEHYLTPARSFLSVCSGTKGLALQDLTAAEVTAFVVRETRGRHTGWVQWIVTGLRSLLRFLHVSGKIAGPLAQAVPPVAGWRLSALPKALEPSQVDRLLASCDQATSVGLRDFAILTILLRLGLRAGEVAALKLSDIDWRHGEIVIHGKANRAERLPLPTDVGQAVVAWLQRRCRPGSAAQVFTRVHAPHHGLTTAGVSNVVRAACVRAGLPPVGSHRLRHTVATQMLRSGAGLAEIGQVLRHRSSGATAIYAKVDRVSLSALARPWPGDAV